VLLWPLQLAIGEQAKVDIGAVVPRAFAERAARRNRVALVASDLFADRDEFLEDGLDDRGKGCSWHVVSYGFLSALLASQEQDHPSV
jgi:hypothetical protein